MQFSAFCSYSGLLCFPVCSVVYRLFINKLYSLLNSAILYHCLSPLIKCFLLMGYKMLTVQFSRLCSYSGLFCLSVCFITKVCTEFGPPVFYIKGVLHPKMKILSFITYPHVVPNP